MTLVITDHRIKEIDNYIRRHGGYYSDWYVGIASKPEDRLFNDHNVSREIGPWIFRTFDTDTQARDVEDLFLSLGCDGGSGGGGYNTKAVYAYKKKSYTRE